MKKASAAQEPSAAVRVRRIYDPPAADDGTRVLVDRLWPRGVSKADARIDEWLKTVAPSAGLRRWLHGPQGSYEEFRPSYERELAEPDAAEALDHLRELASAGPLTLLTAVKDPSHSHTEVLLAHLTG